MRFNTRLPIRTVTAVLCSLGACGHVAAGDLRFFDDAALNAVQFVDDQEGWTVGDDGVIWHTIDGGKNWERQPSGVRASLRSLHFLNPFTGWVVGREELPSGGSAGIVLYTADGGVRWRRLLTNSLPGLHAVRFVDAKRGYLAGEGADTFPSGVFTTADGGRTWQPVPGPHAPAWQAMEFGPAGGVLAGAWNRLATVRKDRVNLADLDMLGARALRGIYLNGERGVAVGQGGLVLTSNTGGASWDFTDLKLPAGATASVDFHAVHGSGNNVWVVGRPGSMVLHTSDGGVNWHLLKTEQPLPLNGVHFRDDKHGWAVGELGTILGTSDGGNTWTVQHRGGLRAAALLIHARANGTPVDTVAWLGAREGYLTACLRVTGAEPGSARYALAGDPARYAGALRQAGGAAAEMLWQFPVPAHLTLNQREDLVRAWDKLHDDHAAEQMLRQLTLALRIWRPDVVITDAAEDKRSGHLADSIVAEAVHEAYRKAGEPTAFPDQLRQLGLETWKPTKLYALSTPRQAHLTLDLTKIIPLLEATVAEFAEGPAELLAEAAVPRPTQRHFRLVESSLPGAASHSDLLQGIDLAPGGLARRQMPAESTITPEVTKAIHKRANLQAMAEMPPNQLVDPNKLLAQIGPMLADMPDDHAARSMYGVASHYADSGQWGLARETFLLMVDRYPAHPLALEAYRWLVRHASSSEARRRHELGQFLVLQKFEAGQPVPGTGTDMTALNPMPNSTAQRPQTRPTTNKSKAPATTPRPNQASTGPNGVSPSQPHQTATNNPSNKPAKKSEITPATYETRGEPTRAEVREQMARMVLSNMPEVRKWYQGAIEIEPHLTAFGPLFVNDPSMQFCLAAARRNLGDFETAKSWYQDFAARQPDGPWRAAAQAELWLANKVGPPPKMLAYARQSQTRPYLDGKLDDPCWQSARTAKLKAGAGDGLAEFPTEVKLAYDREFLYVAVKCDHPAGRQQPLAKNRQHDADLSRYDRISLFFDLDRDYSTSFNFHIDQRGCVAEDCWGDKTWNPRWYVAAQNSATGWTAEAAIPLQALTGDKITFGRTWAFNAVRVVPGKGVMAWSLPAEASTFRPEGMGLLMFTQDVPQTAALPKVQAMPRVP